MDTMNHTLLIAAAISGFVATTASAQTTTFANEGAADDAVTDLEEQIEDDAERTVAFGNDGRTVGSYGSLSLRGTATTNDGDRSSDLGVGLRYGTFDGVNGVDVSASFAYGSENGTETENRLLLGADYRRDFSPAFFGYVKGDASFDKLSSTPGEYSQDVFVGIGAGYRIFNDATTQWSVQAGPGYRWAEVVGGGRVEEEAISASSNFYRSLTETSYITNDTDVIYSDFATTATNELALNVAVSEALTLRTSYITNYNDQTDDSFADAENVFGVAAVYNFN